MDPSLETQPATGALAQVIKQTKRKKKRQKLKLSAKQKLIEKLDKAATALLKSDEASNDLFMRVSVWLERKEKIVHSILYQQCLMSLDQELREMNEPDEDDDDEADGDAKLPETPKPIEIQPIEDIDFDSIDIEELMKKNKSSLIDSSENLNVDKNPVLNIDYRVSYDDFKIVTSDLQIPCSHVGLHAICKILDPDATDEIDYRKFTPAFVISNLRHRHIDCIRFIVKCEKPKNSSSPHFIKEIATNFASKYPLYLKFDIRFLVFAGEKDYRGHLRNEILYSHMKIYSLKEFIKQKFEIASNAIYLFSEINSTRSMEDSKTLEDYGFIGESEYNSVFNGSKKHVLYYDFSVSNILDPILNCDYYFNDIDRIGV